MSKFLSPYTNRRTDEYGGSSRNRARIVSQIIAEAREEVGDFPILIKMNCTDYIEGGIDIHNFRKLAKEVESAGVDAIEVSGGMWDCLTRPENELGFRPLPAPEAHTGIKSATKQSYFLKYAEKVELGIPLILVGGNRDIERIERIVRGGRVGFVALCRPLINEPGLPRRWLEGYGSTGTDCIACNSCIYDLVVRLQQGEPSVVTCLFKQDKQRVRVAQQWLRAWVERHRLT